MALDGDDTITVTDTASVGNIVRGDAGNDTIVVSGDASIGLGTVPGQFSTGLFTGSGYAGGVGETNSVSVYDTAYIANIYGDQANDTFLLDGTDIEIGYWVTGNGGDDQITIRGVADVGAVEGDGGNALTPGDDIVVFEAGSVVTAHGVSMGDGDDTVTLLGSGELLTTGGERGYFFGGVYGGAGVDTILIGETFTVGGGVSGGADADSITIADSASVGGTISGGDDADSIVITSDAGNFTVDGGTGAGNGTDFDTLDLLGISAARGGVASLTETTDADGDSTSGNVTFRDGSVITFSEIENLVVCFAAGTQISTVDGDASVEQIGVGDLVMTADNGYQPVRWVGRRKITGPQLRNNPNLYPVRIRRGAIAPSLPERDLLVSPQHRILIKSAIALKMFDTDEVLIAAKHLTAIEGIDIAYDVEAVEYVHFLCSRHEVVFAEGVATESLYTGRQALSSLGAEAREEIFTIFPELADMDADRLPASARPLIRGRRGRKLATRHSSNGKPLFVPEAFVAGKRAKYLSDHGRAG